ncbi:MAG: hypothetical protein ABFD54_13145 [Armatimonadota bacterium]|nr:hypothetical protein [bacterium]
MSKLNVMPGKLPKAMIALYYPEDDKYVGIMAKQREAISGLLVFENIIHLTLYQCAGSHHLRAVPKVLNLDEARAIVRNRDRFESIIMFRPPGTFVVKYVI